MVFLSTVNNCIVQYLRLNNNLAIAHYLRKEKEHLRRHRERDRHLKRTEFFFNITPRNLIVKIIKHIKIALTFISQRIRKVPTSA